MYTEEKVSLIQSHDYRVRRWNNFWCVSDPLDDQEGFLLCGWGEQVLDQAIEHIQTLTES